MDANGHSLVLANTDGHPFAECYAIVRTDAAYDVDRLSDSDRDAGAFKYSVAVTIVHRHGFPEGYRLTEAERIADAVCRALTNTGAASIAADPDKRT